MKLLFHSGYIVGVHIVEEDYGKFCFFKGFFFLLIEYSLKV